MFKKINPVVAAVVVVGVLWVAFKWWPTHRATVEAQLGGATAAPSTPQTLGQKVAGLLDKVQNLAAKAAVIFPPLAVLTPKTAIKTTEEVGGYVATGAEDTGNAVATGAEDAGGAIATAAKATYGGVKTVVTLGGWL